jgi:hypothetical protein
MATSSVYSNNSILPSPYPTNLGGNTKDYVSVGGRRRKTKKGYKKNRKSKKSKKNKCFFFF